MKTRRFSKAIDGRNDQGLGEMDAVAVEIIGVTQHKFIAMFFDMSKSIEVTAQCISTAIGNTMKSQYNDLLSEKFVSLKVNGTSMNVRCYN